jgi:hypothetical protein
MTFDFNPEKVACAEMAGWRAYYDRDWLRLFRLVAALNHEQFRIPFPLSLLAAYYVAKASVAWVPADHDRRDITKQLEKFYRLALRYSGLRFDPARAAALEEQYWDVHRRLVRQTDKTEFVQIMTDLHSELFGISKEAARESAELRVEANNILDTITGKISKDPEADWRRIEGILGQCYHSIRRALGREVVPAAARA